MKDRYLIFDLGASNGRAMVGGVSQGRLTFEEVHRFENRPVFLNGELFWDFPYLLAEVKIGLQKACLKYGTLKSMAIDTWGCDFGIIDGQGRLMSNPVHYRDKCRRAAASKLHSILSEEELFSLCAGPCSKIMGIYELFSMKERNAFEYVYGHRLLMIPELLNYFLTGKVANEFCNATMTLLVNQNTRQWEPEIFKRLGLRMDLVTPLKEPGGYIGQISDQVCEELGIQTIPVVLAPTHDTAAAVAGIPAQADSRWAFISMGTWGLAGMETQSPILDQSIVNLEYGNEGGVQNTNMLIKNVVGMWVIQQCREKWNLEQGRKIEWNEIVREAEQSEEILSLIDIGDPRFAGVQPHMPNCVQEYCAQTEQEIPETMGEIARVVLRSLAMEFKASFRQVCEAAGVSFDVLHVVGGGIQNKLLCQWTCDAVNVPVMAGPVETTAIGNLLFQMIADGTIQDVDQGRAMCRASYQLETYEPQNSQQWEEQYDMYCGLQRTRK